MLSGKCRVIWRAGSQLYGYDAGSEIPETLCYQDNHVPHGGQQIHDPQVRDKSFILGRLRFPLFETQLRQRSHGEQLVASIFREAPHVYELQHP